MRKDNTPNYQTPFSKLQHFRDFIQNSGQIRDELQKTNGQQIKDKDSDYELPNEFRQSYNKVTTKYDNDSKSQVKDKLKAADEVAPQRPDKKYKFSNDEVNPNHFFKNETDVVESKIIKKFETFASDLGYDPQTPKLNTSLAPTMEVGDEEMDFEGCGCCDDCTGQSNCKCCDDCNCDADYDYQDEHVDYENDDEVKSYMFFGNLETIYRLSSEMCQLDENQVNDLLNQGHNWAEDHISVTKELVSHVYNFLMNSAVKEHLSASEVEHGCGENYMFFANLENIHKCCEEMLELDKDVVDELLENGHDWAEDHISAAKENINQVYEWLNSELEF